MREQIRRPNTTDNRNSSHSYQLKWIIRNWLQFVNVLTAKRKKYYYPVRAGSITTQACDRTSFWCTIIFPIISLIHSQMRNLFVPSHFADHSHFIAQNAGHSNQSVKPYISKRDCTEMTDCIQLKTICSVFEKLLNFIRSIGFSWSFWFFR